jgi:hypothetical protein
LHAQCMLSSPAWIPRKQTAARDGAGLGELFQMACCYGLQAALRLIMREAVLFLARPPRPAGCCCGVPGLQLLTCCLGRVDAHSICSNTQTTWRRCSKNGSDQQAHPQMPGNAPSCGCCNSVDPTSICWWQGLPCGPDRLEPTIGDDGAGLCWDLELQRPQQGSCVSIWTWQGSCPAAVHASPTSSAANFSTAVKGASSGTSNLYVARPDAASVARTANGRWGQAQAAGNAHSEGQLRVRGEDNLELDLRPGGMQRVKGWHCAGCARSKQGSHADCRLVVLPGTAGCAFCRLSIGASICMHVLIDGWFPAMPGHLGSSQISTMHRGYKQFGRKVWQYLVSYWLGV